MWLVLGLSRSNGYVVVSVRWCDGVCVLLFWGFGVLSGVDDCHLFFYVLFMRVCVS